MNIKVARVYLRVSTNQQDLERQEAVVKNTKDAGYYIAAVYREKASGTVLDRPELQRLIADLQQGEVVIAERMDRISRLPVEEAAKLINAIKEKGAKVSVPGLIDLSEISNAADGISKIVLEAVQELLLKISLQMAHDDYVIRRHIVEKGIENAKRKNIYKGRRANEIKNNRIIKLRKEGYSIYQTAKDVGCSESQVKLIWRKYSENEKNVSNLK